MITCTWQEFKQMAKEFHEAAPTMNLEELDNSWKCLGLAYLGMTEEVWVHSASTLLKMECKTFWKREEELLNETNTDRTSEASRCHS